MAKWYQFNIYRRQKLIIDSSSYRNNFDDTPDSIMKRLTTYNEKTKPIASKFKATQIDAGERPADDIFLDIQKIVETL